MPVVVDSVWAYDEEATEVFPGENVKLKLKNVEEDVSLCYSIHAASCMRVIITVMVLRIKQCMYASAKYNCCVVYDYLKKQVIHSSSTSLS